MKSDFAKVRPIVGLFLEALMLVFIFVYSHGDFAHQQSDTSDNPPLASILSFHEIVLRSNWSSQSVDHVLSKSQFFFGLFPPPTMDLPGSVLALSDALSISYFERNIFYVLLSANAP